VAGPPATGSARAGMAGGATAPLGGSLSFIVLPL
jgi:hypothetical protein